MANSFAQNDGPKDTSPKVRIRLVGARQSGDRDLHIIAKFASLDGKQLKGFPIYDPNGSILGVIKSCVWDYEKDAYEWRPLKLDLILSVPRNWSEAVPPDYSKWVIESIDIHHAEIPNELLLGTWRESGSTNTIAFDQKTILLAPALKLAYAVKDSKLVLQKPNKIVMDKLKINAYTNRTDFDSKSHLVGPYTNWTLPFRVTSQALEITWDGEATKYMRVAP